MPSEEDLMELGRDCAQLLINSLWQVWIGYISMAARVYAKVNSQMFNVYVMVFTGVFHKNMLKKNNSPLFNF